MRVEPKRGQRVFISGSQQVYKFIWKLIAAMQPFDQEKEHLFVIGVSRNYLVKYVDHVSMGSMHGTIAAPREIFRNAIHLGASAIFLVHNHPSGSVAPSKEDIAMTKRIMEAGKLLNIEVVDHLIVVENGYYSFADEGEL
jgi:DNA repair protein RadC